MSFAGLVMLTLGPIVAPAPVWREHRGTRHARDVKCPVCGAAAYEPCASAVGRPTKNHNARIVAAKGPPP